MNILIMLLVSYAMVVVIAVHYCLFSPQQTPLISHLIAFFGFERSRITDFTRIILIGDCFFLFWLVLERKRVLRHFLVSMVCLVAFLSLLLMLAGRNPLNSPLLFLKVGNSLIYHFFNQLQQLISILKDF